MRVARSQRGDQRYADVGGHGGLDGGLVIEPRRDARLEACTDTRGDDEAARPWPLARAVVQPELTTVDESVIRLGVIEGDFHWHNHDDTDEFFLVLEGRLLIDLADAETATLERHQGFTVPKGVTHRTRAPRRTAIVILQRVTVVPTGN
jgi:mannose-6-phosphate isomerase-like protein (cupin superfamily)